VFARLHFAALLAELCAFAVMLRTSLAVLLLGAACAQQAAPSIEDMLADTNNNIQPANVGGNGAVPVVHGADGYGADSYSDNSGTQAPPQGQWGAVPSSAVTATPVGLGSPAPAPSPFAAPAGSDPKMQSLGAMMGVMQQSLKANDGPTQGPDMFGRPQGGGGGGGAGNPMAGMMKNPIMGDLLKSVEAKMPMNQKAAAKAGIQQPISQESREIVSGIVEKFMHKIDLEPGEKECLEHNLATLTADVVGTTEDLVKAIKAIIAGKPGQGVDPSIRAQAQGTMVSAGLDGAMKLTSLITLATTLMKNCVQGDALQMLKDTGANFINMQYIGERFLVSGVDIAHRLADGILAFEHHDWHRFGEDIGISLRKILLSNSTRGAQLPEGVPEEAIIQETTEGLMEGFFASGSGVEITDTAAPNVDIQLDLHRCIAGNHEFFKEVWLAMWNLIAELSVNAGNGKFENPFTEKNSDGSQPKWMGEFMVAMMQVPMALSRCNVDQDTQQMMMEAIKSIKDLKVKFLFPTHIITADEATQRMAKAIASWTNWDFKDFGKQIGKLLEEFVLLMYPQRLYIDSKGQRRLIHKKKTTTLANLTSPSFMAFMVGVVSMSMLLTLFAARVMRLRKQRNYGDECPATAEDVELASDLLPVE